MNYVALLRGINVGGNNKVDMKQLKFVFEAAGMQDVRTYINSGNVLFEHDKAKDAALVATLELAIEREFGFHVSVLVKSEDEMQQIANIVPEKWCNNQSMKCDVVFLWDGCSVDAAISQLRVRRGIDEVRTVSGSIIWKVDRKNASKNGLIKIAGTSLYKQVTIRNINTVRKLLALMDAKKSIVKA